jgi:hypothetical protein
MEKKLSPTLPFGFKMFDFAFFFFHFSRNKNVFFQLHKGPFKHFRANGAWAAIVVLWANAKIHFTHLELCQERESVPIKIETKQQKWLDFM